MAEKDGVQSSESTGVNRPITYTTYDNLDEATEVQTYDGDGVTISFSGGVPVAPSSSLLRSQEIISYDDQGRVYQDQVYNVDQSDGSVSDTALTTNYYYDHRGDLVAEQDPSGLWTKDVYDGADRLTTEYTTDGAGGTTWADAISVASDDVLEQTQTVYDANSNVIETIDSQRSPDASGTGPLAPATDGVEAVVYYTATYYDAADRPIADVNVGTNGGSSWTRPDDVPSRSDDVLVTSYSYNVAGLVEDVTDPMGIVSRTEYDALGRTTETIANYTGSAETADSDVATQYTYDGDNNVLTVTADEPGGAYQTTEYVYGVTTGGGSAIDSNDLLAAVEYPNASTGAPSSSSEDTYTYNALGQVTSMTDRDGNVHQYTYDVLGRLTADAVTTLGSGVDGSVRRIEYGYDALGNVSLITSYDAASGGSIVNQVLDVYTSLGQLTAEYQSVSGAVDTDTTPAVQYAYDATTGRLTSITYPDGYVLDYNYGSSGSLDDSISRLASISDETGTLESYVYQGLNTVVERDHPQDDVNLIITLDAFGRVAVQDWYDTTTSSTVDYYQYGYDADGNVHYSDNLVDAVFSELYTYNNLNELTSFERGTLTSPLDAISGTPTATQSWDLDALGNFTSVTTNGTTVDNTANQQNEYTALGSATPTYDANGNMTTDETGQQYVYDAWNRLVEVKDSSGDVEATYSYDGLGRRVSETHGDTTTDLYFSAGGQVLEEDVSGTTVAQRLESGLRQRSGAARRHHRWHDDAAVRHAGRQLERDGPGEHVGGGGGALRIQPLRRGDRAGAGLERSAEYGLRDAVPVPGRTL